MTPKVGSVGVILAGGRSSRMGQNKAEMQLAGEPLLARVARSLSPAVDELLVIGPPSLAHLTPQARVIADSIPGRGPLGGLYTALTATTSARIFVVACDMPFVRPGLVLAMLARADVQDEVDVVTVRAEGRLHPLHAVYAHHCLPIVEQALKADDYSLHALLAQLSVVAIDAEVVRREDPNGISAFNVNTPADWLLALRLADADGHDDRATADRGRPHPEFQ